MNKGNLAAKDVSDMLLTVQDLSHLSSVECVRFLNYCVRLPNNFDVREFASVPQRKPKVTIEIIQDVIEARNRAKS